VSAQGARPNLLAAGPQAATKPRRAAARRSHERNFGPKPPAPETAPELAPCRSLGVGVTKRIRQAAAYRARCLVDLLAFRAIDGLSEHSRHAVQGPRTAAMQAVSSRGDRSDDFRAPRKVKLPVAVLNLGLTGSHPGSIARNLSRMAVNASKN
jgi:hypothetical protein